MVSIADIDRMLFEADIEGGLVAWLHDENVLEVRKDQAEPAARLLHQAMTHSFVVTFPNAPTRDLIKQVKIGQSWAEAK
jgi:DNA polymerase I-like protein with 3'-5' exonuclease and polymerase domains